MEHSDEYRKFMKYLGSSIQEKLDGFDDDLLEKIYDWERDEVEDIIWNMFHGVAGGVFACYLPKLSNYDGLNALKRSLSEYSNIETAKVLYESTGDDSYLDVFMENYNKSNGEGYSIVAALTYCKPCKKMFEILCDIYLNADEKLAVQQAAKGIFYYIKGINPNNLTWEEEKTYLPIWSKLADCEKSEREKYLKKETEDEI